MIPNMRGLGSSVTTVGDPGGCHDPINMGVLSRTWGLSRPHRHGGPVMSLGTVTKPQLRGSGEPCHDTGGPRGPSRPHRHKGPVTNLEVVTAPQTQGSCHEPQDCHNPKDEGVWGTLSRHWGVQRAVTAPQIWGSCHEPGGCCCPIDEGVWRLSQPHRHRGPVMGPGIVTTPQLKGPGGAQSRLWGLSQPQR